MTGSRISGAARLAGVMGWPVAHSLSPRLHGFWLDHYRIDGAYVPLPVRPEDLRAALGALPKLGFAGANVTVPHKVAVRAAVDEISPEAERIGAVNTLVIGADGRLSGSNSDAFGFRESVRAGAPAWSAAAGAAVVLGAGGASRAVLVALLDAGVAEIRLANRSRDRAEEVAGAFGAAVTVVAWEERSEALAGAEMLVNTTSLGMAGQPPLEIALDALPPSAVVVDIVYRPLMTGLLEAAQARGNVVVDGLGMLLHQARAGFRAWFGVDPEVTPALRAAVLQGLGDAG